MFKRPLSQATQWPGQQFDPLNSGITTYNISIADHGRCINAIGSTAAALTLNCSSQAGLSGMMFAVLPLSVNVILTSLSGSVFFISSLGFNATQTLHAQANPQTTLLWALDGNWLLINPSS